MNRVRELVVHGHREFIGGKRGVDQEVHIGGMGAIAVIDVVRCESESGDLRRVHKVKVDAVVASLTLIREWRPIPLDRHLPVPGVFDERKQLRCALRERFHLPVHPDRQGV